MRLSTKTGISALAFMALSSVPALAQTATFDDLANGSAVPVGYAVPGMSWYNWYVVTQGTQNNPNCAVSLSNCAYNGFGMLNSVFQSTTPFKFNSGYFEAWFNGATCGYGCAMDLTVNGWNGGLLVGTKTFTLSCAATQKLTFDYSNVTLVTFDTHVNATQTRGNWYLADNLVFNDATTVPEPASLTLLATGMGVLGAAARRRWRNGQGGSVAA